MQVMCPACAKTLEFSGERPRFCAFCGQSLGAPTPAPDPELTAPPATEVETAALSGAMAGAAHPETIGGYRLGRRLGGGAMGAVYEAEEIASGRRVALKLMLPEFTGSPDALVRFRQEGRLASTLAHPRCVFVLAADEDSGRPYIVMELMPGKTLDDLVRDCGPLPPEEAIAKILDVIDGLDEAHRLGLVHRDVKPSNCFLEADGRVKVGDFGLVRSLEADTKLTRTGAFIGTPLYAAPEQIHKNDPTDAQSDVYSVAATLYFLLTGQAPFQSTGDAMATLARKVTENPPPMRSIRPGLPRALDKVVLRGLERDRHRRWKDVAEFRRALVPFLPAQPSAVGMGLRFIAYQLDLALLMGVNMTLGYGLIWLAIVGGMLPALDVEGTTLFYGFAVGLLLNLAYFGLLEGIWGWSLGKLVFRVRVGTVAAARAPGLARAMLRTGILSALFNLGPWLSQLLVWLAELPSEGTPRTQAEQALLSAIGVLSGGGFLLASVLTVSTMRVHNGYRGLHELLTGTRTYRLRWPTARRRRAPQSQSFDLPISEPDGLHESVGPFAVYGALHWTDQQRVLLAEDPRLGRSVWLYLRPASAPLDAAQRGVDRMTRVRWVSGGTDGTWQWDAFLAPTGMPLPALAADTPRPGWGEVRLILEDLADELAAACADGTLPPVLTAEQVWVQPDGRVQLLTLPIGAGRAPGSPAGGQARALHFLREVAVVGLEGVARPIDASGDRVRAPVPVHAEEVLGRLLGNRRPYTTVEEVRGDLEAVRDRPAEVSRARRAAHLALMALFLHVPFAGPILLLMASFTALCDAWDRYRGDSPNTLATPDAYAVIGSVCGFWILWAFLCRGGYLFWRGGIVLRRADGRKPSRAQCGLRALLIWGPVAVLYCTAIAIAQALPQLPEVYFALWGVTTLLLPLYAALAVEYPQRSLHDRIAGTYLMPE